MKPRFDHFNQVCVNSNNVREISDIFTDIYGLGPWLYVTFGNDGSNNYITVDNVVIDGKLRSEYSLINGTCKIGSMEFECLQPAGGLSVNSEFMDRRGGRPGLQHLCLDDSAELDAICQSLDALGLGREQRSCIDQIETCIMRDLTQIMGCCIELHGRDADFRYPEVQPEFYPASNTMEGKPSPALGDTTKVTYVVSDIDTVVEMFQNAMQVCAWEIKSVNYSINGSEQPVRQAVCKQMNLEIELLEPLGEEGLLADFLRENGPSGFSVGMKPLLDDEELRGRMEKAGYGRRMAMTVDGKTRSFCDHIKLIGLYIELV